MHLSYLSIAEVWSSIILPHRLENKQVLVPFYSILFNLLLILIMAEINAVITNVEIRIRRHVCLTIITTTYYITPTKLISLSLGFYIYKVIFL